jgi:hypothetical protein
MGVVVLAVGLLFFLAGWSIEITEGAYGALFFKGISFIPTTVGMMLLFAGKTFLAQLLFPLSYLIFMILLPDGLFTLLHCHCRVMLPA